MSKFLVTGGAGFIGSHIAETLVRRGHSVRVLDNFSKGKRENLKEVISSIDLIGGDIRNEEACFKATKNMDFVLHHAALIKVPESLLKPEEYNQVNIQGTINLLKASLKNKIRLFVLASSCSVYGDTGKFPQREDFLPQPISPYALTKLTAEHYCRIYSGYYKLPTVSLRYFNVFGPRQSPDDRYASVIPKFIKCMLYNQDPPIYGTGRQSRDFVYVDNVVEANILATQKRKFKGEILNIAEGKSRNIISLVRNLNQVLGKDIQPVFKKERPGDIFKNEADILRAKKLLRYNQKVSFMEGLRLTVEYWRKNG